MIKFKFKKWWYNLIPKYRKWLRDCEKVINSPEVQKDIENQHREAMYNFAVFGQHPRPPKKAIGQFLNKDIKDIFEVS